MARSTLIKLAVVASAIAVVVYVNRGPSDTSASAGSAELRTGGTERTPDSTTSPAASTPRPRLPGPPRRVRPKPTTRAARLRALDERIQAESADTDWSATAEHDIARGVKRFVAPAQSTIACRATLCRVELAFADAKALAAGRKRLHRMAPWPHHGYYAPHPDDPRGLIVYLAREGKYLPVPR